MYCASVLIKRKKEDQSVLVTVRSIFSFELIIKFTYEISKNVLVVPEGLTNFLSFLAFLKLDKTLFA
jgi:hypothetical protein